MSKKELSRLEVIQRVADRRLSQGNAAVLLSLSLRQVKRLLRAYRNSGPSALVSKRRGHPSNHQLPQKLKDSALRLIKSKYSDFGPTLAHEKLSQVHNLDLSVESLRQLMISEGLWQAKARRKPHLHQSRQRRSCLGELVQLDGSPHDWFEGRAPYCTLLVFIDDATGQLMQLMFANSETTFSYFEAVRGYLLEHGLPRAFYNDKHSIFRPTQSEILKGAAITQFGRAMQELQIEVICANTPQAKGRVERVNQTLQDRLVKEMRLKGICSIEEGNRYLPEFIKEFNQKFGVEARSEVNAHRKLEQSPQELDWILSRVETRVLSKNLELSYDRVIYQIETKRPTYTMRKARVEVRENTRGEIRIEYKGKPLSYKVQHKQPRQAEVKDAKAIQAGREEKPIKKGRKSPKPSADHPWRRFKLRGSLPPVSR